MVNGIVSLISLSDLSLLVYRNAEISVAPHFIIYCAWDSQGQSPSLYRIHLLSVFCRSKWRNMSGLRIPNTDRQSTILFSALLHAEVFRCVWYLHFLTLSGVLKCKLSCFLLTSVTTEYEILAFSILLAYKISNFQNIVYISSLQLSLLLLSVCIYYITVILL